MDVTHERIKGWHDGAKAQNNNEAMLFINGIISTEWHYIAQQKRKCADLAEAIQSDLTHSVKSYNVSTGINGAMHQYMDRAAKIETAERTLTELVSFAQHAGYINLDAIKGVTISVSPVTVVI